MALSDEIKRSADKLNARQGCSIPLNSGRVPAQQGNGTLVIGVGGTGCRALLETKRLIDKTCCLSSYAKDSPTENAAYLCLDTDAHDLKQYTEDEEVRLTPRECVCMADPHLHMALGPAGRPQLPDFIREWLDPDILNVIHPGAVGSGGVRQCGRLLLFRRIEQVCSAIHQAVCRLAAGGITGCLNICIMTGVGGGTGSGAFLDLAFIARELAERILPGRVNVYGYIFMPDVNLGRPLPEHAGHMIRSNGFAALRELDHLMGMSADGGRFTQRYSGTLVIDTNRPPFDHAHLISAENIAGAAGWDDAYRRCLQTAAQSVLAFVVQEQATFGVTAPAMQRQYEALSRAVKNRQRIYPERQASYLALNGSSYELPVDDILKYTASLLFDKMDGLFENRPTPQDAEQACRALRLKAPELLYSLAAAQPDFVPDGCRWEDLFGKSPRYDLDVLCDRWVREAIRKAEETVRKFLRDFENTFHRLSAGWFTDVQYGPIWLNCLLDAYDREGTSLLYLLYGEREAVEHQLSRYGQNIEHLRRQAAAAARDAASAHILLGNRNAKTMAYIGAMQSYAVDCVRLSVLEQMRGIYMNCIDLLQSEYRRRFAVAADMMQALREICRHNAAQLTCFVPAGGWTAWDPITIPDISGYIAQAVDRKGDDAWVKQHFTAALFGHLEQLDSDHPDVFGFLCGYLDAHFSDIVNDSLETYVSLLLGGMPLSPSVHHSLMPRLINGAGVRFIHSANADMGDEAWLLTIPGSCPNVLAAVNAFCAANPMLASTLILQVSEAGNCIRLQGIRYALPLSAYVCMYEYENCFLNPVLRTGLILRPEWEELPSPIPCRSRPPFAGAYPAGVQQREDRQRALYRACREVPVIRAEHAGNELEYRLYFAELPDLEVMCGERVMRRPDGSWDVQALDKAAQTLGSWLAQGLPGRRQYDMPVDAGPVIMRCPCPETDARREECELAAAEHLLGQYNNLRRAAEELEKYNAVRAKLAQLEQWCRESEVRRPE